jgi:hypothetical protein
MRKPFKLSKHVYVTQNALVEFKDGGRVKDAGPADAVDLSIGLGSQHEPWGVKDAILKEMHDLCSDNPTKWRLIATRRDFVIGKGLQVGLDGMDEIAAKKSDQVKAVKAFLKNNEVPELMRDLAFQLEFSGRYFVKLTLDLQTQTVGAVELIDVFHCRPRKLESNENRISAYVLNPNFGTKNFRLVDNQTIPAFDVKNPTRYAVSIIDSREKIPGQIYHPFAFWWGTKWWTIVSNKVPRFHENGLENGYNLKYHVSIPDNYFEGENMTETQEEALKIEVCEKMDETLRGKTDSVLFTFHTIDVNGKEISGVKVTELANNMSDDAYTAIFNTANLAQASAHGIIPILAGIDTGSKLGGSGKEMEVAANYIQAFLVNGSRMLLLKLLEIFRDIEGWSEELTFEFENVQIYNFDVTPTAAANNKTQNPSNGTTD